MAHLYFKIHESHHSLYQCYTQDFVNISYACIEQVQIPLAIAYMNHSIGLLHINKSKHWRTLLLIRFQGMRKIMSNI